MKDFDELFDKQTVPPADPQARRKAISAAMREYQTLHATQRHEKAADNARSRQGLAGWLRHRRDNVKRSKIMALFTQRTIIGGTATACALVVGLAVLVPQLNTPPSPEKTPAPPSDAATQVVEEVVVTGVRQSLPQSVQSRRKQPSADQAKAPLALNAFGEESLPQRSDMPPPVGYENKGRDQFEHVQESAIKRVTEAPVSTFSIDVDTASYSFVRRQLNSGVLPQKDAVRVEEMVNYFDYGYPLPESREQPFRPSVGVLSSPWAEGKKLIHIGIKGYNIEPARKPKANLVFLLDVSGSMNSPDKLPLVKQSMEMLLSSLQPDDTVAIVVYAGAAGKVLEPTPVKEKQKILEAMSQLNAGGSTAGAQGIKLAYLLAEANFDSDAVNRVILATDGDFNVGITDQEELQGFIERKRDAGIFLSILGFGQGNYNDHLMQVLAQNGNGVAAYIDTLGEAQKVLLQQANAALFPIAKDVKIQMEFNPATVAEYRLIGYETRALKREDFNNDTMDAGDIGAGHSVTAIYEITPVGSDALLIENSRYIEPQTAEVSDKSGEYAFLKIRYKRPDEHKSRLLEQPITIEEENIGPELAREVRFATAVAGFAQKLKGSKYIGDLSYDAIIDMAHKNKGDDPFGYRTEFVQLVRKAKVAEDM